MALATNTWQARLDLGFSLQGGSRSVLSEQRHEGPLLVQRALYPEGPAVCHVALLHPPSGIAGGDEIDIALRVAAGAHATLTTPGATRWYKANGSQARQTIRLSVEAGARLDWLPLENIYYEQADAINHIDIQLDPEARAIGWEISQLGSILVENHWRTGRVHVRTALRVGSRLLWVEQGEIDAQAPIRHSLAGLAGEPVFATLWCFGETLADHETDTLATRLPWREHLRAGMTVISYDTSRSLYLIRVTGLHAEEVRALLTEVWALLRHGILGVQGTPLRLWNT
ncbi:Urease accessory protein UreD [Castellaniella defragrans]